MFWGSKRWSSERLWTRHYTAWGGRHSHPVSLLDTVVYLLPASHTQGGPRSVLVRVGVLSERPRLVQVRHLASVLWWKEWDPGKTLGGKSPGLRLVPHTRVGKRGQRAFAQGLCVWLRPGRRLRSWLGTVHGQPEWRAGGEEGWPAGGSALTKRCIRDRPCKVGSCTTKKSRAGVHGGRLWAQVHLEATS